MTASQGPEGNIARVSRDVHDCPPIRAAAMVRARIAWACVCSCVFVYACAYIHVCACASFQRCACECRKECVFVENIESMRARVKKREECTGEHVHAKEGASERGSKKQQAFTQRKSEDEPD